MALPYSQDLSPSSAKVMRRIIYVLALVCCTTAVYTQQLPLHTQYLYNKLAYNPAYAGGESGWEATAMYRNQWIGLEGAPTVLSLSAHGQALGNNSALGLQIQNYSIGISSFTNLEGMYAYHFPWGEGHFSLGVSASMRNVVTDYTDDRLISDGPVGGDPSLVEQRLSQWRPNFGLGVYYETESYFIGVSAPRLIKQDLQFDEEMLVDTEETPHYFAMLGGMWDLSADAALLVQSAIRTTDNSPLDVDLSAIIRYKDLIDAGINYRFGGRDGSAGDSIDLLFSWRFVERARLGIAYDMSLGNLRQVQNGSLELLLQYRGLSQGTSEELVNPRTF